MIGKGALEYSLPFYGYRRLMLANLILMPEAEVESRYTHVQREGDTLLVDTFIPNLPGGSGRNFWVKASPLYDPEGNVTGAIETIRDTDQDAARWRSDSGVQTPTPDRRRDPAEFPAGDAPADREFEIAAQCVMAREVGGDFFDVIPFEVITMGQDRLGIFIADVSGKGIPAALFMALSRIVVRVNAIWHQQEPAEAIRDANAIITADSKSGMFVTLFYGILDAQDRSLTYVNAGHNPPLIYRSAEEKFSDLPATGMAIGAVPDAEYGSGTARRAGRRDGAVYRRNHRSRKHRGGDVRGGPAYVRRSPGPGCSRPQGSSLRSSSPSRRSPVRLPSRTTSR